jgi:hypothetical protein
LKELENKFENENKKIKADYDEQIKASTLSINKLQDFIKTSFKGKTKKWNKNNPTDSINE